MKLLDFAALWRPSVIAIGLSILAGCAGDKLTDPSAPGSPDTTQTQYTLANAPPFLAAPGDSGVGDPPSDAWYIVAQGDVSLLQGATISGSRYSLTVPVGAVPAPTHITIEEWNSGVVDFQLKPHGQQFLLPVTLTVDYSGTNADSSSANFDGSKPTLLWFNTATGFWEIVISVDDPVNRGLTATLTHFSRYACKGTAEW